MSDKKINVAWVSGGYGEARNIFAKIKERFKDADTFICDRFTEPSMLMSKLTTNQCFSTKRVIRISELPDMTESEKKKFRAALENLEDDIFVVFYMISPSDEKAVFNTVEKIGKVYDFVSKIPSKEASAWIDKRCKELQIEILPEAIEALVANCGLDNEGKHVSVDVMEMTLSRLMLYMPNKKKYDNADIIATAVFYESFIIWDLLNCCDNKEYESCLNMFAKANTIASNYIDGLAQMVSTMLWKYRLLLFLKEKISVTGHKFRDLSAEQRAKIVEQAASLRKITYEGQGFSAKPKVDLVASGPNEGKPASIWSSFIVNKTFESFYGKVAPIEKYTRKELYLIVNVLENAAILLRSCHSENEALLIADTIAMTVCSSFDQKLINNIHKNLIKSRN